MLAHKLHWPHLRLPSLEKLRVYLFRKTSRAVATSLP
jgi:hypothetical protein